MGEGWNSIVNVCQNIFKSIDLLNKSALPKQKLLQMYIKVYV